MGKVSDLTEMSTLAEADDLYVVDDTVSRRITALNAGNTLPVKSTGATTARTLAAHLATLPDSKIIARDAVISRALADRAADRPNIFDWIPTAQHAAILAGTTAYDAVPDIETAMTGGDIDIHFPGGTFLFGAQCDFPANDIGLKGEGRRRTVFKAANGLDANILYAATKSGLAIRGIRIDGNKANQTAGNGVLFQDVTDFDLEDLQMDDVFNDAVLLDENCWDGSLRGIGAKNSGNHSISLSGDGTDGAGQHCRRIDISGARIFNPVAAGINVSEGQDIDIADYIVVHDGTGGAHSSGYGGVRVTNGAENVAIGSGTVRGMSRGLFFIEAKNCSAVGYTIIDTRLQGIFIADDDAATFLKSQGIAIGPGVITNPGRDGTSGSTDGILIRGSVRCGVSGVVITDGIGNMEYGVRETNSGSNNSGQNTIGSVTVNGAQTQSISTVASDTKVSPCNVTDHETAIASAATIALPPGRESFNITGTTNIDTINGGWTDRIVTLRFAGVLTVNDTTGNLNLAGNFVTTGNDTITLRYYINTWYEVSRSAN